MIKDFVKLREHLWTYKEIGTYAFVIDGKEKVLLIDTAYGLHDLKEEILQLCGRKEIYVVNLHAHLDHNAGNNQFDEVHVGRLDEPYSHKIYTEKERKFLWDNFITPCRDKNEYQYDYYKPGPATNIIPLSDGDMIDLGDLSFEVLETPGHTMGSICLWEKSKKWLFSGDMILTWPIWCHMSNSSSLQVYGESLKRLRSLHTEFIFPSHWLEAPNPDKTAQLPPKIIDIYAEGVAKILSGEVKGKLWDYSAMNDLFVRADGKMSCDCLHPYQCFFELGGVSYDPKKII